MSGDGHKHHIHKKEGGYALLIVMLALILISMFAVTFYTTSASHRLQQQQVESSTLSVGAAEMGVQRVHYELKEKVNQVWREYRVCLESLLNAVTSQCDKDLEERLGMVDDDYEAKSEFGVFLDNELSTWVITEKSRLLAVENGSKLYEIQPELKVDYENTQDKLLITYKVKGWEAEKERELIANVEIEFADPLIISNVEGGEIDHADSVFSFPESGECPDLQEGFVGYCKWTKSTPLKDWLKNAASVNVYVDGDLCRTYGSNNCNNLDFKSATIFNQDGINDHIFNNFLNGTLIYDGTLAVNNINGKGPLNSKLVIKNIDLKNKFKSKGNVILAVVGKTEPDHLGKFELLEGDRVCINVDGLDKNQLKLIEDKFTDKKIEGKVYLYHSTYQALKQDIIYTEDFNQFLSYCDVPINHFNRFIISTEKLLLNTKVRY
ncbi:hypothetical protein [Bhargavaea ginsengi]|uniref:hypothetical protein n=1 Tax=Bhargavaea ginsengi TaxID=426757 RepID=UPI003C78B977